MVKKNSGKSGKEWRKDVSNLEEGKEGKDRLSMTEKESMNRKCELEAKDYLHIIM